MRNSRPPATEDGHGSAGAGATPSAQPVSAADVHRVCTRFHAAIELIGTRWTGAILRAIFTDAHRYALIKAAIPGISDTMLAQRLHTLESEGLIERRVIASTPVGVEYHLTEMGRGLAPTIDALIAWSHQWIPLPDDDDQAVS